MADLRGDMLESNALASALGIWTYQLVEERLIETFRMWRHTPGHVGPGSGNPYASDFPADLIVKDAWEYDKRGDRLNSASQSVPMPPLSRKQIAERDTVSEWMRHVPERDRKLVTLVLSWKAAEQKPDWMWIKRKLGISRGADGLRMRYSRAITSVCNTLNSSSANSA